jgi:hypothetical protein
LSLRKSGARRVASFIVWRHKGGHVLLCIWPKSQNAH